MTVHAASGQPRRNSVLSTVPSEDLAGLDLPQLRGYRHGLEVEEDKVSYWRRLAHARIDVLEAQSGQSGTLSLTDLVRVLGDTASGHSRRALVSVKPKAVHEARSPADRTRRWPSTSSKAAPAGTERIARGRSAPWLAPSIRTRARR